MPAVPWRRNALTALEWTLCVPVIPALLYTRKLHHIVCVIQFSAFMWLVAIAMLPEAAGPVPWWALVCVLLGCWMFHAVALQFKSPKGARMVAVRMLGYTSIVNFATCLPIHFKHTEHRRLLQICRVVVHSGVAVAAALLLVYFLVFVPTYDAWGCYPPGLSLTDHNLGMCGTKPGTGGPGWWTKRTTKESEVCIVHENYTPDCRPPLSTVKAFGAGVSYGHNALLCSIAAYILGVSFAWEAALDDSD